MLNLNDLMPSVVSAASGLFGALIGGLTSYLVIRTEVSEKRHAEYRERALAALDEASQSLTRFETWASMIDESATDAQKKGRRWKVREAGFDTSGPPNRPITWAIQLYAPHSLEAYKMAIPALSTLMARAEAAEKSDDVDHSTHLAQLIPESQSVRVALESVHREIDRAALALESPIRP